MHLKLKIQYQQDILKEEYNIHGLRPEIPSDYIVAKEKLEYDLADYICVPTEFVKKTFINNGIDKSKIIKIPYGVNLKDFKQKTSLYLVEYLTQIFLKNYLIWNLILMNLLI